MTNYDRWQVAAELLDQAKEEHGNPSQANTFALIGIGTPCFRLLKNSGISIGSSG
jgi:hypothetical protein